MIMMPGQHLQEFLIIMLLILNQLKYKKYLFFPQETPQSRMSSQVSVVRLSGISCKIVRYQE